MNIVVAKRCVQGDDGVIWIIRLPEGYRLPIEHLERLNGSYCRVRETTAKLCRRVSISESGVMAMWYVVQVIGGREKHVLNLMRTFVDEDLLEECFIPQYEVMKRMRGEWQKRSEILIPGYLFVVTKNPDKLSSELRKVPEFTKLLGNNVLFIPLPDQEVAFVNAFTAPGHRVVEMSEGVIEGDEIVVLNGPLMGQAGLIKKIDRHKRLAYLEIEILGRKKSVKLGLEIVRKRP